MSKVSRFFRTYFPFARSVFLANIQYRMNFVMFLVGEILSCFVLFFVWRAVFEYSPSGSINGMSFNQMILYVFISFLTSFIVSIEVSWPIGESIRDGSISMRLIKPIRTDMSFFFEGLGGVLSFLIVGIFVFIALEIWNFTTNGAITPIRNMLFYVVSTILSMTLYFLFSLCIGYLAFFFKNLWGINMAVGSIVRFLSGGMIPLILFPENIRHIFELMPFASMNYVPVMIYLGKMSYTEMVYAFGLQIFWIIAFLALSKMIWGFAARYLSVQGG